MNYIFSVYSMLFLVTALISFYVSFLAWRRRRVNGAEELAVMMLAAGLWAFADLFEISVITQADKILWSKIEYIGSVLTPVFYLLFVLKFTGVVKISQSRLKYLFFVVPLITLLLVLTNEKHNLIWTGFSEISQETNIMRYYHGVGFYIGYMLYNYIILFVASILLLRFILTMGKSFQKQGWIIVTGSVFPWIASIIYLSNSNFLPGLSITPLSFAISGIMLIYAILYFRLLDLVPVARELLVETLPDGIVVLDRQQRIQDINESAMKYLDIQSKGVAGKNINECECGEEEILREIKSESVDETCDVRSKNGKRIISIIKKKVNELPGSKLVILRDVSEEREHEAKLRRRDELLFAGAKISTMLLAEEDTNEAVKRAIDILGEASGQDRAYLFERHTEYESGIALVSQRYEWTKAGVKEEIGNPELQNIDFGEVAPYSNERLSKGQVVDSLVKELPESEREVLSSQGIVSILLVPIHVDGKWWGFIGFDNCEREYKWLEGEKALLGTVASSIGSAIGRRKVKESLVVSEERYKTITGVSNIGVWEYNSEEDMVWCSPEYFTMLGFKSEEFKNEERGNLDAVWTNFLHPEDKEAALKKFGEYLIADAEEMYENYFRMSAKDGSWIWVWSRGRTMRDRNGDLTNITVGTHIDITERKKAEEELVEAKNKAERGDRLKTEFIHNISHEIRTPLNGIVGFGQLMAMPEMTERERHEYLELLNRDTDRLIKTVDDYMDISLLSSGNMVFNKREFNLRVLFDELYTKFSEQARERGTLLKVDYPDELNNAKIVSDQGMVFKVMKHLMDNAIKYTKEGEVVTGCVKEGEDLVLYVKDTGAGIGREILEKIFEPFVQEDTSMRKKYEGSGLGLAIAKGITEQLGGVIGVESVKGRGSKFYIKIGVK